MLSLTCPQCYHHAHGVYTPFHNLTFTIGSEAACGAWAMQMLSNHKSARMSNELRS